MVLRFDHGDDAKPTKLHVGLRSAQSPFRRNFLAIGETFGVKILRKVHMNIPNHLLFDAEIAKKRLKESLEPASETTRLQTPKLVVS